MSDKETTQIDFPSKFDDAQKAIKALKSTMDEEASSLFEERKEFEEMRTKLDSVNFEKHIKFQDVVGHLG